MLLTQSDDPPEVVLTKCRERIDQVADPSDRAGLLAVLQILSWQAYGDRKLLELLGGTQVMIESPLLDEARELIRAQAVAEGQLRTLHKMVRAALQTRFARVSEELITGLDAITDGGRLEALHQLAITCPTLDVFLAALNKPEN